ncbi:MAG TPA: hypothetical protein VG318_14655 [Actinomycetota bacterium]|nr:hypothetical protein [Actinomycetota bacterium]
MSARLAADVPAGSDAVHARLELPSRRVRVAQLIGAALAGAAAAWAAPGWITPLLFATAMLAGISSLWSP